MNIGPHDGQRPGLRTSVFQNNFDAANFWQEWRASVRRENSKSVKKNMCLLILLRSIISLFYMPWDPGGVAAV